MTQGPQQATAAIRHLVVFSRAPVHGLVKTRLAARLGADLALAIHRYLLRECLKRGSALAGVTRELCLDAPDPTGECAALAREHGFELTLQSAGDLGNRMASALARALSAHRAVVLIGSDCPLLDEAQLQQAFVELESHDAVFAPVADGGYALVGLRRPLPGIFEDVAWSTGVVMALTRQRLSTMGASWAELSPLWDIDEAADWARWCAVSPRAAAEVNRLCAASR